MAFMPFCDHDPDYAQTVIKNNENLLKQLSKDHIIQYNLSRPEETESMLTSFCLEHRLNAEVMIVPQGPKLFSLLSKLIAVRYPDIKLWEIIVNNRKKNNEQALPAGKPIVMKTVFINEDIDIDE